MTRIGCAVAMLLAMMAGASGCARSESQGQGDEDEPRRAQQTQPADSEGAPKTVTVDAAEQARLGVVVSKLTEAPAPSGSATTARVLDPGPLLALDNELEAAAGSLNASQAEALRTRQLFNENRTASAHAVEAAASQAQADRQRLESARRRLVLEWGEGIAHLAPDKRAALLNELAQVRAELIRVELPVAMAAPQSSSSVAVRMSADSPERMARVLGTLPSADPRLQTRGLLAELRGPEADLAIGSGLLARIPGQDPATGVLIPRSALIRKDSKVWAYVQTAPTQFLRREVADFQVVPEGWFVRSGFAAGDTLVTGGAASLFAIEAPAAGAD
jgi:hypothetical protein